LLFDLSIIENYIKNTNNIKFDDILISQLSQSKSYLKIIGISYLMENTNILINFSVVRTIIKNTHIFNDVSFASKPWVMKVLPKLNMIII